MTDKQPIDDARIHQIIQNVMHELGDDAPIAAQTQRQPVAQTVHVTPGAGDGLFHDPDSAINAALQAFEQLHDMPLERRKQMIDAMRSVAREYALVLAQFAAEETGMGRAEDKAQKNLLVANKTPGPEFLDTMAW